MKTPESAQEWTYKVCIQSNTPSNTPTLHSFLQTLPRTQTNNQDLRIFAIMISSFFFFTEGALFHFPIQYIGSQKKKSNAQNEAVFSARQYKPIFLSAHKSNTTCMVHALD